MLFYRVLTVEVPMKNRPDDAYDRKPPDPRVERLAGWLRGQPDAPGLLEEAARVLGFDALLLDVYGDQQHRIHQVGDALVHEITRIPIAGFERQRASMAAVIRALELSVEALRRVRGPRGRTVRDPMANYAEFIRLADRIVILLAVADRDDYRAMFIDRAKELIGDLATALDKVEGADSEWSEWEAVDSARGSVFDRDDKADGATSPRAPSRTSMRRPRLPSR